MTNNLRIYEAVRTVPPAALKEIQAGRLKGKSDINPMWRFKTLTEQFGPVGVGWKYVILDKRLEQGANGEIAAFVDIDLYYKENGEWSAAIPGTGGSSFVTNESKGLYVNDECFKMALTDAISVSCKALGFGADVYWNKDATKYTKPTPSPSSPNATTTPTVPSTDKISGYFITEEDVPEPPPRRQPTKTNFVCSDCNKGITEKVHKFSTDKMGKALCMDCQKKNG